MLYKLIVGLFAILISIIGFVGAITNEELKKEPLAEPIPYLLVLLFVIGFYLVINSGRKNPKKV